MDKRFDNSQIKEDTIDIRAELEKYLSKWKYLLLSAFLGLLIAVLYIKSQNNVYLSKATLLIKEDGGASSDLLAFQDLSALGVDTGSNLSNEIEILRSRSIIQSVIEDLKLDVNLSEKKLLKEVELYKNPPLKISILSSYSQHEIDTLLEINVLDKYKFNYKIEDSDLYLEAKFGDKLTVTGTDFVITPSIDSIENYANRDLLLNFSSIESTIEYIFSNLTIEEIDKNSSILLLTFKSEIKEKSQDILNAIVREYESSSVKDKNEVAVKTDEFLKTRLEFVKKELDEIDKLEESYKSKKQLTNISIQSESFIEGKSINEKEIFNTSTQLDVIGFMIKDIQKQGDDFNLLPNNIGSEKNPQLSSSVISFNELLLERNRLLRSSSKNNPVVKNLNIELSNIRDNIKLSLINTRSQLEIRLKSLNKKFEDYERKITSIPKQVREYRTILRRQNIIAGLYSYLLKKKEENEITMAIVVPGSKIIDRAYTDVFPIAPKKKVIVLVGLIIGLIIPIAIIYLKDLLTTTFKSRKDVEGIVGDIPVIGDIPLDKSEEKVVVKQGSRTSIAEAFRLLRTNLDFMLAKTESKCKVIFTTSTVSGEGKSFVSVNLASSLAISGKKVILVGMDLRAPKITQYLEVPHKTGVANYLIDPENHPLSDLIFKLKDYENLDILSSGTVAPNPAELLMSPKLKDLFDELRSKYDYVVLDTAPVSLVTDTLMIGHYADTIVYVTRANYLDKRLLEVPQKLYKDKRLPNMAILVNGLTQDGAYGYGGYGYAGYAYNHDGKRISFLSRFLKRK